MLEPKEKAKELYWEFYQNISDTSFPEETAKKCALIAVGLRLDGYFIFTSIEYGVDSLEYWLEVKTEIRNLKNK